MWTVEGLREYLELHRRNYELDDLWGPDKNKCSDDFARFTQIEKTFQGVDNIRALLDEYDALELKYDERGMAMRETGEQVRSLYVGSEVSKRVTKLLAHVDLLNGVLNKIAQIEVCGICIKTVKPKVDAIVAEALAAQ